MKRLIFTVLTVSMALSSLSALGATSLKTPRDKLSYAMGAVTGQALKAGKFDIDPTIFCAGLVDFQSGKKKTLMTTTEVKQTIQAFQQKQMAEAEKARQQQSLENAKQGESFIANYAKQPGVKKIPVSLPGKTKPTQLLYKVIHAAKTKGHSPSLTDEVTVNYEGRSIDGKVFDSSYKRGKPVTFPLSGLIKGWQSVLTHMQPEDTWEVVVPSDLAYGTYGAPPSIGPNETLIFKLNLVSVSKKAAKK